MRAGVFPRLVVMAKEPRAGRVKTRLARDIGTVEATGFYRRALEQTVRRLRDPARWETSLAVAPDAAVASTAWPPCDAVFPQGPGDLGARMGRIFELAPPGPLVIIGSDIPGIEPADIAAAFQALKGAEAVIGPASDGGYWLIGLGRRRPLTGLFRGVRWSGPDARADTVASLRGARVAFVRERTDVDAAEGYRAWRRGEI